MDMEIVKNVTNAEKDMTLFTIGLIVALLCGVFMVIMTFWVSKDNFIKRMIKSNVTVPVLIAILLLLILMPFIAPNIYENPKNENLKVEGQATLQKYEKVDDYTVANLKGKGGKVFKIYLDEDDVHNHKADLKRGDKVHIKSEGMYQLKREVRLFSPTYSKDGYELEKGSELEKVE